MQCSCALQTDQLTHPFEMQSNLEFLPTRWLSMTLPYISATYGFWVGSNIICNVAQVLFGLQIVIENDFMIVE